MVGQVLFNRGDQGRHAREASSAKTLHAEVAEPTFDQIQPGARGRSKVEMTTGVSLDPGFHPGMFMRAIIIHDQMEIEFGGSFGIDFLQETEKLLMPMARHAISDHFAVEHAESGKQSGRPVTDVIMGQGSAAAFLQGQAGLGSVQGLDLAFFVHAQNQRLVRRIQIKSHDIVQLLNKTFVPAEFEGPNQVGFQVVFFPDSPDGRFAQFLGLRHRPGTPVGRIGRLGVKSRFDHGFNFPLRDPRDATRTGGVFFQPGQAECQKPFPPKLDGGARDPQFASDGVVEHAGRRSQNDLGALDQPGRKASAPRPRFQNARFLRRQDDLGGCSAHRALTYTQKSYLSSYL